MGRFLAIIVLSGVVASSAAAREPSAACDNGEVATRSTPAAAGVRQAGDPYQEPQSVYVCSGSTVPGALWLRADTNSGRTHVIYDGDSTNHLTPCSDGYAAARADASDPSVVRLYRADDGDFSFIARDRPPEQFARGALSCAVPTAR